MIKVDNRKCIRQLTKGMMKNNRSRNTVAVIAIALITFMLLSVFSLGLILVMNYNERSRQYCGTTAHAYLSSPEPEQVEQIRGKPYTALVGVEVPAAISKSENGSIYFYAGDEGYYQLTTPIWSDFVGDLPRQEEEVILSQTALDILDISDPQMGMRVKIPYRMNIQEKKGEQGEGIFILCGWYQDGLTASEDLGSAHTSMDFFDKSEYEVRDSGNLQILFVDQSGITEHLEELREELELKNRQRLFPYTQPDYSGELMMTAAAIVLFAFLVALSGYLLTYNVFYLSLNREIRFYGLLKTIGTTSGQLRTIIAKQAFRLAALGIPSGLLAGVVLLLGIRSAAAATRIGTIQVFHPAVFLFTVIFSLITLWISVRRSAMKVAEVSPVEAIRFTGSGSRQSGRSKDSIHGGKIWRMAWRNVFRDRRRAIVVIASLLLGLTIFSAMLTFINAMDPENMVQSQFEADIAAVIPYENPPLSYEPEDLLNEETLGMIERLEGVKDFFTITGAVYQMAYGEEYASYYNYVRGFTGEYTQEEFEEEFFGTVCGISRAVLERYYPEIVQKVDLDAFERGELVFKRSVFQKEYSLPEDMELISKLTGESFSVKCIYLDTHIGGPYAGGEGFNLIGSAQLVEKMGGSSNPCGIYVNVKAGWEERTEQELKEMMGDSEQYYLESRREQREALETLMVILRLMAAAFTMILSLVGIVNYVNIMVTSVQMRKLELSVLESIGMTGRQMCRMLIGEGICYAGVSLLLSWTVGLGVSYFAYYLFSASFGYAVFRYPAAEMLVLSLLVLVICILTPVLNYRSFSRRSLTERIREIDSG